MKAGLHRRGVLVPVLLAGLTITACSAGSQAPAPQPAVTPRPIGEPPPTTTLNIPTAAEFDRLFIDMMVPHHEGAIEMAGIARSRVEHEELKQLVTEILRTQAAEASQLRRWRQEWYGSSATPPMSQMPMLPATPSGVGAPHTMNMAAEVVRLRSAPEPFDRAFIDAMIPHHRSAVEAARLAEQQATRPEVKELARSIAESQQREIDQLRQWRRSWYGSAEPGASPATPGAPGGPATAPSQKPDVGPDAEHGH
jgi:uncharacterized protein (DUF305 family)